MRPRLLPAALVLAAALAVQAAAGAAVSVRVTTVEGQTVALLQGDDGVNSVVVNAGANAGVPYVDFAADGLVDATLPGRPLRERRDRGRRRRPRRRRRRARQQPQRRRAAARRGRRRQHQRLIGSEGPDLLQGGDGNDWIEGANAADEVDGGPGDDRLYGESSTINVTPDGAPDVLRGGDGADIVGYAPRGQYGGVTVSLDGVANDGVPGENDNVDAEAVIGTVFDDTLTGGPGPDRLDGDKGNDTIAGLAGPDTVLGGDGGDTLTGGDGNDTVTGGFGEDRIDGGPGTDTLQGDTLERNVVAIGNDVIEARDGRADSVDCGIGADVAHVDAVDVLAAHPGGLCESVDRSGATGSPQPTAGKVAAKRRGGATRRKGVQLQVALPAAGRVTLQVRAQAGRAGSARSAACASGSRRGRPRPGQAGGREAAQAGPPARPGLGTGTGPGDDHLHGPAPLSGAGTARARRGRSGPRRRGPACGLETRRGEPGGPPPFLGVRRLCRVRSARGGGR